MESSYYIQSNNLNDDRDEQSTTMQTIDNTISSLKKNLWKEEEFHTINHLEQIHIFLKLKPFTNTNEQIQNAKQPCFFVQNDTTIQVNVPKTSIYSKAQTTQNRSQLFKFSYVFPADITQHDFFQASVCPCIPKLFQGDNLLIFSYGVTNSGKTYTMQGNRANPGLIPRTIDSLINCMKESLDMKSALKYKPDKFNEIQLQNETEISQTVNYKEQLLKLCANFKDYEQFNANSNDDQSQNMSLLDSAKFCFSTESLSSIGTNFNIKDPNTEMLNEIKIPTNTKYGIWISFYELYNDSIFDLLVMPTSKKQDDKRVPLKIREDSNRIPYVEGLIQIPIFNMYEAIKILKYGEKNLQKSSNSINLNSSRSHAVFCCKIVTISFESTISVNQLSFCDLAGIERSSKTKSHGKTLKEASTINSSLLALSRCINMLMYNQKNKANQMQVPYRVNKLTRLFQAYFEGRGMLKMIVNINPSITCFDETLNVLKFSSIANQIQIGQNEDDRIQYKIEPDEITNKSVAWETDETALIEEDEDEDDDDDEEEEEEEEEEDDDEDEDDEMEVEDSTISRTRLHENSANDDDGSDDGTMEDEDDDGSRDSDESDDEDDDSENNDSTKRQSSLDSIEIEIHKLSDLNKEQLIEKIRDVKQQLRQQKEDALTMEYDIRTGLVNKWSKQVEDTIADYEKEIKVARSEVEQKYLKRIEWIEQLRKTEYEEKLNELEERHKQEIEKLSKQTTKVEEIRKSFKDQSLQTDEDRRIIDLHKKIDEIQQAHKAKIGECNEMSRQNKEYEQKVADLYGEIENYGKTIKEFEKQKRDEIQALDKTVQQHLNEIRKLKDLVEADKNVQTQLEDLVDELERDQKVQKDKLTKEIDALKVTIKELETEKDKLNGELQHIKVKQLNDLHMQLYQKESEIYQYKTELNQANRHCVELEKEIEEMKSDKENIDTAAAATVVTTKKSSTARSSKTGKSSKTTSKSSVIASDIIEEDEILEEHSDHKESHLYTSTAVSVVEESVVSIDTSKDHGVTKTTAAASRKKSTLNRITEMISKSPILESVRNRPLRGGKSKAQTISTTADKQLIADVVSASDNGKKTRTTKSTLKKSSLLEAFEQLKPSSHDHAKDHSDNDPASEIEDGVKPKKTRRVKK